MGEMVDLTIKSTNYDSDIKQPSTPTTVKFFGKTINKPHNLPSHLNVILS